MERRPSEKYFSQGISEYNDQETINLLNKIRSNLFTPLSSEIEINKEEEEKPSSVRQSPILIESKSDEIIKDKSSNQSKKKFSFILGSKQSKWIPKSPPKLIENGKVVDYPQIHSASILYLLLGEHINFINDSINYKTPEISKIDIKDADKYNEKLEKKEDKKIEKDNIIEKHDSEVGTESIYTGKLLQMDIIGLNDNYNPNYHRIIPVEKYKKAENHRLFKYFLFYNSKNGKYYKSFHLPKQKKL